MSPFKLLRQSGTNYSDLLVISQVAMLENIQTVNVKLGGLAEHQGRLTSEAELWVPVGSVEFVREAMLVAGIKEPENLSYPEPLMKYLGRSVRKGSLSEVSEPCFIKPQATKLFTGFVYDPAKEVDQYSEHDIEQLMALTEPRAQKDLWISEPVSWSAEFRFYILNGKIAGFGRYDDNEEEWFLPDLDVVNQMLDSWRDLGTLPAACSIDVGVLSGGGGTTLVECNDAWALGYYKGSLNPSNYVQMLAARWIELRG
ncbi:hypothetical protein CL689_06290 [Candidatus Saccharibacteria bacterium]|nr:hypothetical protein [Candidatus Saccharibacteria bacterium]